MKDNTDEIVEIFLNDIDYPQHTVAQLAEMFNTTPDEIVKILVREMGKRELEKEWE